MQYLWYVKDLFDVHEVGDVPRVLGEGAQRKSIMSDKCCGTQTNWGSNGYKKISIVTAKEKNLGLALGSGGSKGT